jgi:hypothetical protein
VIELPKYFEFLLLVIVAFAIFQFWLGIIVGGGSRVMIFHKEYTDKFTDEHMAVFPKHKYNPSLGLPDTGNGLYAKDLTYKQWFDFNV